MPVLTPVSTIHGNTLVNHCEKQKQSPIQFSITKSNRAFKRLWFLHFVMFYQFDD